MENEIDIDWETKQNPTVWKRFILILLIALLMFTCGYFAAYEKASIMAQGEAQQRLEKACYGGKYFENRIEENVFEEEDEDTFTGSLS